MGYNMQTTVKSKLQLQGCPKATQGRREATVPIILYKRKDGLILFADIAWDLIGSPSKGFELTKVKVLLLNLLKGSDLKGLLWGSNDVDN